MTDVLEGWGSLVAPSTETEKKPAPASSTAPTPPATEGWGSLVQPKAGETGSKVSTKEDIGKSIGSGLMNIPIQAVGLPGDVQSLTGGTYPLSAMMKAPGLPPEMFGDKNDPDLQRKQAEWKSKLDEFTQALTGSSKPILPTSHGISETVSPAITEAVGFGPEYKPQTKQGEYGKTMVEFLGPSMFGKGRMVTKAAEGLAGGAGSQLASDVAKEYGFSPTVQTGASILGGVLGAVLGGGAATKIQDVIAPTTGATEKAADLIAQARRERPQTVLSDEQVQQAIREGKPIGAFDMLGKRADDVLTQGSVSETGRNAAIEIDNFIKQRNQDSFNRVDNALDAISGRRIDAGQTAANLRANAKIDNKANFDAAMNAPISQNIETQKDFNKVLSLIGRPLAQPALDAAYKAFDNKYQPTLKFWHEVKMNLDDQVNKAYRDGDNTLGKNLKEIRDNLRDSLKSVVPEYEKALNKSSEYFGAQNALEAGQNYAKNFDAFDRKTAQQAFNALDPEAQKLFQDGMMTQFKINAARSGATDSLVSTLNKRDVQQKIADIFPPDQARQIDAMLSVENIMRNHNNIRLLEGKQRPALFTPNVADVASIAAIPTAMVAAPTMTLAATGLAATVAGTHILLNVQERRIAGELNRILSQTTVGGAESQKAIAELSALAAQNPAAGSLLNKIGNATEKAVKSAYAGSKTAEDRQQRKAGGRVMRDAISLAQEAVRTRKAIGGKTEQMLSMPDDAIVSALHTAKNTLGGSI